MKNPEFLKRKYQDLAGSKEVSRAVNVVKKEKKQTPYTREERIDAYLSRLEKYFGYKRENEYVKGDERGFELLKNKILDKYVTKYEEIPESYFENILRDSGRLGDWNTYNEEDKEKERIQNSEAVLSDQRASLEEWVDYMSLKDSAYIPSELKYFIIRNVVQMSEFDKEKKLFGKRSTGTVQKFPDLNHEALGYLVDGIIKKWEGKEKEFEHDIQPEDRDKFKDFVNKEDFQKLYAWCYENFKPIAEHLLPITEGLWVKYNQNSNPNKLVESIRGKGTGWCTAGEQTAKTQLKAGDFHVYYTKDDDGQYSIPRIAIRKEGDSIAEVRGIAYKQNLDPYMGEILDKKLGEFPDKEKYIKKDRDNRELTKIDKKVKHSEDLTKEELIFIYEINQKIDSFGYNDDPRIKELRDNRAPKLKEDVSVIFDLAPDQIAYGIYEINEKTKAYIGEWNPEISKKIPENVEYLYESFPDKKILRTTIELSTKSPEEYTRELREQGFQTYDYAQDMLNKMETLKQKEKIDLVSFSVGQLGFPNGATLVQIYDKAKELDLELCPPQVGPELRLNYKDQPNGEWLRIAMEAISGRDGRPRVFRVVSNDGGLWLCHYWSPLDSEWASFNRFVFRSRKN